MGYSCRAFLKSAVHVKLLPMKDKGYVAWLLLLKSVGLFAGRYTSALSSLSRGERGYLLLEKCSCQILLI